jgi:hypothetical protein
VARRDSEEETQTLAPPLLGATYGSLVIVAVIAILNTQIGRDLEDEIDAPARTLIAAPVVVSAVVVFVASMVALILPPHRRPALRVAELAGWLIPAWLIIGAMVLGAISVALNYGD